MLIVIVHMILDKYHLAHNITSPLYEASVVFLKAVTILWLNIPTWCSGIGHCMCCSHAAVYAVLVHYLQPVLPMVVNNVPTCYVKSICRSLCSLPSISHPRRQPGPTSSWLLGSSVAFSKHCLCVTAFSRGHTGIAQISPNRCWYPLSVSRQASTWSRTCKIQVWSLHHGKPIMWHPCGLKQMCIPPGTVLSVKSILMCKRVQLADSTVDEIK